MKSVKTLLGATALTLAALPFVAGPVTGALAQEREAMPPAGHHAMAPMRTIAVTGTGEASARPDMATVTFSVEARGDTAAEALSNNNRQMNAAMAALKKAGIAERDMQTTGLYLSAENRRDDDGRWTNEIDFYSARNTLTVKVRDIDDTGSVIDAAVKAGINGLGGISYGFADDAGLMEQARKEAVDDARAKAQLYAAQAGVTLGDVVYITEPGASQPPQPMLRMEAASFDAGGSSKIAPGENSVSASVSMVFSIR